MLKNFRALENIRNSQVGHIQIDYRIACAMINFTHKPCISDGKNSIKIAKRIKKKAKISTNNLEFLLKKRLDTKLMPSLELIKIEDFPKLKIKDIKERICFGTFQLKQSKSYLADLVKRVKAFKISSELIKQIKDKKLQKDLISTNSTILAAEIPSRHKRSRIKTKEIKNEYDQKFKSVYKVFIHYQPYENSYNSIKGIFMCFYIIDSQ